MQPSAMVSVRLARYATATLTLLVPLTIHLSSARADHTPEPVTVTVPGSLQSELGCPGDWQPDCAATHLTYDADDGVWQETFNVPAGSYEYKAALNDAWDENYGSGAQADGPNIALSLGTATDVKFYYDHETHYVTDNVNSEIAVVVGSFQDELGCPGDWQPWCLQSWLQDPDGDGVMTFLAEVLPAGNYEAKVAHDEDWAENYGAGGLQNGPNIPFTVAGDCSGVLFSYDLATHVLTIDSVPGGDSVVQPNAVTVAGSLQSELGCPGDWQPDCAATHLTYDADDGVWQAVFNVLAGDYEYKAPLNDSWDENYGANAQPNGANIPLSLGTATDVKFYYDHATHWITDDVNSEIAVVAGSFQSELGCPGDWQPDCLQSWLQDPDGDGVFTFSTNGLPAGNYEAKVAHDESWNENYGQGGVQNGSNIPFLVPADCSEVVFSYDLATHVLTIEAGDVPPCEADAPNLVLVDFETVSWDTNTLIWEVAVRVRNDGAGTAIDVGAQLMEEIAWVTPVMGASTYGDVAPGATALGTPFVLDLTGRPGPGGFNVFFELTFRDECGDALSAVLDPKALPPDGTPAERPAAWLGQNEPNPFNPSTSIHFVVFEPGQVDLVVYDTAGRRVRGWKRWATVGEHTVVWDGTGEAGERVASGVYYYTLRGSSISGTRKMVLSK